MGSQVQLEESIKFSLNDKNVEALPGETILEAAKTPRRGNSPPLLQAGLSARR